MKDLKQFIKITIREFLNENRNTHLVEVIPNKYVYHTSNPIFRDKISKEGLIPQGKSESWLSNTKIDGKVIFVVNDNEENYRFDSTYDDDIYRIDTSKINNKWYNDPNFASGGIHLITFDNIPLSAIKLIYKGSFTLDESINIENNKIEKLVDDFINHFTDSSNFNINNIPKEILNKFPDFSTNPISYKNRLGRNEKIYAGVKLGKNISDIRSWTLDEETAVSFSEKHNNGKIIELTYDEFLNNFQYFVSMDVIYDYILKKGLYNEKLNRYYSESEIVILKSNLNESINIENPQTDEYNDKKRILKINNNLT